MINNSLNLKSKQTQTKNQAKIENKSYIVRPRLACKVNVNRNNIVLYQNNHSFIYQANNRLNKSLQRFFYLMDGTRTVAELQQIFWTKNPQVVEKIISDLEEQDLIDDATPLKVNSGSDVLQELDYWTQDLLFNNFNNNLFKQFITSTEFKPPVNVLYGFALEQYQVVSRKSAFYSPALDYGCTDQTRKLIDRVYCQEITQEKLLLEALNTIGISNRELTETIPLAETVAISQALAYWANSEPLFFFYAIAIIKQRTTQTWQAYLEACQRTQVETQFLNPIKELAHLNRENQHFCLTRQLFLEVSHLEEKTKQRFRGQIYLLVEMYHHFHNAISNHYSSNIDLLRSVSLI